MLILEITLMSNTIQTIINKNVLLSRYILVITKNEVFYTYLSYIAIFSEKKLQSTTLYDLVLFLIDDKMSH